MYPHYSNDSMRTEGLGMYLFAVLVVVIMAGIIATMVLFPNGFLGSASQKTITVRASGTSYGYPSEAAVYFIVNGTGRTSGIATSNLSLTLSKLNYTISKYVNSSMTKTMSYSLYKIRNSSAYSATEELEYTTSADNVSALLGAASSINNTYVTGAEAELSASQRSSMISQALSEAMANATSEAMVIANSSVSIMNVSSTSSYVYPVYGISAYGSVSGPSQPAFYTGTQSVTEQVTVTFKSG